MFTLHSSSSSAFATATAAVIIAAIILSVSAQAPAPSPFSGTKSPKPTPTSPVKSPAPTTSTKSPAPKSPVPLSPAPTTGTNSPTPKSPVPLTPAPTTGVESPTSPEPVAPAPTTGTNDCTTPLFNLTDCLSYVQMPSNVTMPDKNCCPELAGLIESNPICLCELLSNSSLTESFGIKIDVSRALKLPSVCGLKTPSVSLCSAVGYPVPGPTASDAPGPQSGGLLSPGVQPPEGLASSPSAGNNGSGASNIGSSAQAFFIGLAFSFLVTFF